jgi:BirA family biotin operon repressor/biotin-[acetyl-CoA-carboxylase] ligase
MVSAMWAGQWDVRRLDEVDSTNTHLRELARRGAPEGLVVVADHQRAGRGRLDRRWESPPRANLLVSALLRPDLSESAVHLCTGGAALAAADACREVAGVEPELKWPNDLVVQGSKLAGILAEAEFGRRGLEAVVVGIGLNVAWPGPPDAKGTCLDALGDGPPVDRTQLLDALLGGWADRRAQLEDAAGRERLADEIRRRCGTLGHEVRVVLAEGELTGVAATLDDQGRLVLRTADGDRAVSAGDVTQVRPADRGSP